MKTLALLLVLMMVAVSPVFADQTTAGPFNVTAQVNSVLQLNATVYDGDAGAGQTVSAMNFGNLAPASGGLASSKWFTVILSANTSSRAYQIKSTASALTDAAAHTIPTGACTMNLSNNPLGAGAAPGSMGSTGSFVGTNKVLYTSDAAGSAATIGAYYAVNSDTSGLATQVIPLSQPGGTYTSQITYTLVTT